MRSIWPCGPRQPSQTRANASGMARVAAAHRQLLVVARRAHGSYEALEHVLDRSILRWQRIGFDQPGALGAHDRWSGVYPFRSITPAAGKGSVDDASRRTAQIGQHCYVATARPSWLPKILGFRCSPAIGASIVHTAANRRDAPETKLCALTGDWSLRCYPACARLSRWPSENVVVRT